MFSCINASENGGGLEEVTHTKPGSYPGHKEVFDFSLTNQPRTVPHWLLQTFTELWGLILNSPSPHTYTHTHTHTHSHTHPPHTHTHTVHGEILCNKKKSGLTNRPTSDQTRGGTRFIVCKKTVHYTQRKSVDYILYENTCSVMNSNKSIIKSINIVVYLMITGRIGDWRTALV